MSQQDRPNQPVIFEDKAGRFQAVLSQTLLSAMQNLCAESANLETGGILIGHYTRTHHTAVITRLIGPPSDSRKESASFFRGTTGLGNLLESLWPKQEYYLGEWHYHPGGKTQPSYQDRRQMQSISEDPKVHCPEPLLIILSDDDNPAAYVFPRLQEPVYLAPLRQNETNGGQP